MKLNLLIEGYTADELLQLPSEELDRFVFVDEPIVFRAGTAEVLGSFRIGDGRLVLELAHIDGGGEGVLPLLSSLATGIALKRGLHYLEWFVHAVSCATPNIKLRRVLERRGFAIMNTTGVGEAFYLIQRVGD